MISSVLVFTSVISALVLLIHYCIQWRKRSYIYSLLPGPKSHHIILGDLPILVGRTGLSFHVEFFQSIRSLTEQFRKEGLCRVWAANHPYVLLFSAETVEQVFTSQTLITKAHVYDLLHPWLGTGLLTSTGKKWKARRKLITPAFHYRILDDFFPIFDAHSKTFVKNIARFANNEPVDIVPHISLLTLDIICETAMGINIGAQSERASEYVNAITGFCNIVTKRSINPWLQNPLIFSCTKEGAKMKKILKILRDFSSKVVKQRKEELFDEEKKRPKVESMSIEDMSSEDNIGRKKRLAFLDLLLRTQFTNSMTDEDVREEVDTFMFEGHDTTAAGISWALYHLGNNLEIQHKAYEELHKIFGGDKNRDATLQDLREMKYLECILKESQRLSPSVPMFLRSVSEEINIKGYIIPRNSTISLIVHQLHRDPSVFPDPDVFDPDRFLPENCVGRHPFAYVPFSAGPRNCIVCQSQYQCGDVSLSTNKRVFRTGEYVRVTCTGCTPLRSIMEQKPIGDRIESHVSSVENRKWSDHPDTLNWGREVNEPGQVIITCHSLHRNKVKTMRVHVYGESRTFQKRNDYVAENLSLE